MDDRQVQLKRKILILRIVELVIMTVLCFIIEVLKTVYTYHRGRLAVVVVALMFCVFYPISRRISSIKAELVSLA